MKARRNWFMTKRVKVYRARRSHQPLEALSWSTATSWFQSDWREFELIAANGHGADGAAAPFFGLSHGKRQAANERILSLAQITTRTPYVHDHAKPLRDRSRAVSLQMNQPVRRLSRWPSLCRRSKAPCLRTEN